jgi:hypothetical protein
VGAYLIAVGWKRIIQSAHQHEEIHLEVVGLAFVASFGKGREMSVDDGAEVAAVDALLAFLHLHHAQRERTPLLTLAETRPGIGHVLKLLDELPRLGLKLADLACDGREVAPTLELDGEAGFGPALDVGLTEFLQRSLLVDGDKQT